jgi:hypothetical protein
MSWNNKEQYNKSIRNKQIYKPELKCSFKFHLQIPGAPDCGPLIEL